MGYNRLREAGAGGSNPLTPTNKTKHLPFSRTVRGGSKMVHIGSPTRTGGEHDVR